MNEIAKPRRSLILSMLAALLLAACSQGGGGEPPLAGARLGGPFTLVNQDGRQVSEKDFAGQYRLVYFGFTYCPDVCPVDLQLFSQALRQLEKSDPALAAKVQPIFISVDPERDNPKVLKEFVSAFHPRLVGLTGTKEQIAAVVKSHGAYSAKQGEPKAEDYMVDHSRITILYGPEGQPLVIVPHDQGVDGVVAELKRWVK